MKREYFDIYRDSIVKQLAKVNCENWLLEEITNLYCDFGQRTDNDQLRYEANRLKEIVISPKYRNWTVSEVHFALQGMLSGTVDYKKVTIKSVQSALDYAFRLRQDQNRRKNDNEISDSFSDKSSKEADYWLPYIRWWMDNEIDSEQVSVEEYNNAKQNGMLNDLTTMWKGSKQHGPLMEGVRL